MPSVIATGRALWKIYGLLTFFAISLILFTGLSLWESVNLAFAAVSTGGFTLHEGGILFYNSSCTSTPPYPDNDRRCPAV